MQKQIRVFIRENLETYITTIRDEQSVDIPVIFYVREGYTDPASAGPYPVIMTYLGKRTPTANATKAVSFNVLIAVKSASPEKLEELIEGYTDAFKELQEDYPRLGVNIVDSNITEELFFSPLNGGDIAVININLSLETDEL
jgi:hypothetical protein